jgi:hypothetical protein
MGLKINFIKTFIFFVESAKKIRHKTT